MTAGFFADDPVGLLIVALICYVAILLYATTSAVRGVRRTPQELIVSILFVALLPVPAAPAVVYVAQLDLFLIMIAALGISQVRFALLRYRSVRAYAAGMPARPIGLPLWLVLITPAVLVSGYPIASVTISALRAGGLADPAEAVKMQAGLAEGLRYVFLAAVVYAGYMTVAWCLDQPWVRAIGRIRLLSADARFVWINLSMGAICVAAIGAMVLFGTTAAITRYVIIAVLVLSLMPVINGLSWVYDAVFRRLLILHVLFFVGVLLVLGLHAIAAGLGFAASTAWWISLAAVVVVVLVLPARVDALLERFFFPRSGRMRARLVEIATEPVRAANRGDAGATLLRRLVEVLDSEGGIFVAGPVGNEPAVVHCVGRVDANVLGGSAIEAARYVATLPLTPNLVASGAQGARTTSSGAVCAIEYLPLAHQLRLLEAGIVFVCPLVLRDGGVTLLLGPRHGWLYDVATVNALRVFASQAGLALENLTLAHARAHAEKLAALGEAAARIAHEIRNPLSAARSLVQLAGDADGVGALATPALTELDRIGQLVTDLLTFARRDDAVARSAVDLTAVCRAALAQVSALAKECEVEVQVELDPATVQGDANRLVQVVANLCRNAIEALAASASPRRLHVTCTAGNGSAHVEVRDNGPGVSEADRARIFEPFATTKTAGTGLGLPIARRIVEAHAGTLTVESDPSAATVFRVALPLAS
jgi:signal transduction histidine kinase